MDDAELDILEAGPDSESGSDARPAARKSYWVLPVVGFAVLAFAFYLLLGDSRAQNSGDTSQPDEAMQSYKSLSNEMHTGLRLARLDDFIAQHADSPLIDAVRARRYALKQYEESAWAAVTDAFYDAEATEESKAKAVEKYTSVWTPLHRPKQLNSLEKELPNDAVPNFNPGERRSRFASGGNDQFLEGAPLMRAPPPVTRSVTRFPAPERVASNRVVEARIRSKRKPRYPSKAKRRQVEADVMLELDIDDRGRVARARVVSVRANRYADDFAKAATRAARRTRFHPKTIGGRPVATSSFVQKYAFRTGR